MLPNPLAVRRHLWRPVHQRTEENGAPAGGFLARRIGTGSESRLLEPFLVMYSDWNNVCA